MDITTLAAGGEFLGGIAVVISLVYLAGQIRQNSNLLRTSATSITSQLQYGQNEMIARDSEVAQLFYKGASEPDSLTEVERLQFEVMLGLQVQALHQSFEFHEKGIGTEAPWYWINGAARWSALQPGFKAWWPRYETHYMPAFRDFANGLTRRGDTTPDRQLTSPGVDRATLHAGFSSKARR